ncbi:MAG: HEPN domain-containing protein [Planctomycetia bacterium]
MKPAAREWVDKAEADFLSAGREYRARNRPHFDATCFFAQQCIEKYLKARLVHSGKIAPRTHDLPALLDAVLPMQPLWETFRPQCDTLTSYAVVFRYPGESATRDMAKRALADCRSFRREIRRSIGLRLP